MTLHASLQAHNPGVEFFALVADEKKAEGAALQEKLPFSFVFSDELDDPLVDVMSRYYGPLEFTNALRPRFFKHLFSKKKAEKVIYLDSDILVTGSFKEMEAVLDSCAFALTPHISQPPPLFPPDWKTPKNMGLVDYGFYNSGFQAYRRCETTDAALEFLAQRLRYFCFLWPPFMFGDQKWLDIVAMMFQSQCRSLSEPIYNIAYWNFYERPIELINDTFYVEGKQVVFFHLSGFDPERPERWTHLNLRVGRREQPDFDKVIERYVEALSASNDQIAALKLGQRYSDKQLNGGRPSFRFSVKTAMVILHVWSLWSIAAIHNRLKRRTEKMLMPSSKEIS